MRSAPLSHGVALRRPLSTTASDTRDAARPSYRADPQTPNAFNWAKLLGWSAAALYSLAIWALLIGVGYIAYATFAR